MAEPAPLLVIVGPTAAGKTEAAMAVARERGGEIVSADSVQVYRRVDIGSAKPSPAELAEVPHHGIDLVAPDAPFDAWRWTEAADRAIADIRSRGRVPLVCGGTGLYVRALLHGLVQIPPIDLAIRQQIRDALDTEGLDALFDELMGVDREAAVRIGPTDPQRITRALEVFHQTGRPLSSWQAAHRFAPRRYAARVVGLWPARDVLRRRIAARVPRMLARGWVAEVAALLADGVPSDATPLRSLGYREVVLHLQGELPADELAAAVTAAHNKYARRQLTWFRGAGRRDDDLVELDPTDAATLPALVAMVRGPEA